MIYLLFTDIVVGLHDVHMGLLCLATFQTLYLRIYHVIISSISTYVVCEVRTLVMSAYLSEVINDKALS